MPETTTPDAYSADTPEAPVISQQPAVAGSPPFKITVVTTGGTISKTYDPHDAVMRNVEPVEARIIRSLRLAGTTVKLRAVMNKDSLEMTNADRATIVRAVKLSASRNDAVVVIHGTDTMTQTTDAVLAEIPQPRVPIIFTGAMVPHTVEGSDGQQNVTEALFACRLLPPGVYIAFHGRALRCPGIIKDREALTFVHAPAQA